MFVNWTITHFSDKKPEISWENFSKYNFGLYRHLKCVFFLKENTDAFIINYYYILLMNGETSNSRCKIANSDENISLKEWHLYHLYCQKIYNTVLKNKSWLLPSLGYCNMGHGFMNATYKWRNCTWLSTSMTQDNQSCYWRTYFFAFISSISGLLEPFLKISSVLDP